MAYEVNLDSLETFAIFDGAENVLVEPDLNAFAANGSSANPRSSQRRLRTETHYRSSQGNLDPEPIAQMNVGLGGLSTRKVAVWTSLSSFPKNNEDSNVMVCAKKVQISAKANWFGFIVGGAMMLAGAAIAPIAPVAAAVLIPGGFGFMMNEAVNAGNNAFAGIEF